MTEPPAGIDFHKKASRESLQIPPDGIVGANRVCLIEANELTHHGILKALRRTAV